MSAVPVVGRSWPRWGSSSFIDGNRCSLLAAIAEERWLSGGRWGVLLKAGLVLRLRGLPCLWLWVLLV